MTTYCFPWNSLSGNPVIPYGDLWFPSLHANRTCSGLFQLFHSCNLPLLIALSGSLTFLIHPVSFIFLATDFVVFFIRGDSVAQSVYSLWDYFSNRYCPLLLFSFPFILILYSSRLIEFLFSLRKSDFPRDFFHFSIPSFCRER